MDGSEEVRYGGMVKSAVRVIEILEFFEAERRALKVSEIVEGLRMPQSSVSTLMKTLAAQGYVEFDPETRRYRPAPRLAFLGHWALGGPGNIEQVQNLMRALAEGGSLPNPEALARYPSESGPRGTSAPMLRWYPG